MSFFAVMEHAQHGSAAVHSASDFEYLKARGWTLVCQQIPNETFGKVDIPAPIKKRDRPKKVK